MMDRRRPTGIAIFCLCIAGFFMYAYLVMLSEWGKIVLELSVLMIVGGILGTVAWIGYTMATTRRVPSWYGLDDDGGAPGSGARAPGGGSGSHGGQNGSS